MKHTLLVSFLTIKPLISELLIQFLRVLILHLVKFFSYKENLFVREHFVQNLIGYIELQQFSNHNLVSY